MLAFKALLASFAPLSILHYDERMVAVDKPSGLAVHRGQGDRVVAMTILRDQLGRWVHPVHRIDRPTSGVLLFALDPEAARALASAFAAGRVQKSYLALCRGVVPESGRIDHPVPKDEGQDRVPAVTRFARLWDDGRCSWVRAWPETGRRHQIRRHLKHLSHPLVGDVRYGKGDLNRRFRAEYGLCRLALHAESVALAHPVTGAPLTIVAPLPADLRDPLLALGVPHPLLGAA